MTIALYIAGVVAGGIALTAASGAFMVRDQRQWWFVVLAVAIAAAMFNLIMGIRVSGALDRDVVTVVVEAILCSGAIGATASVLRGIDSVCGARRPLYYGDCL